MSAQPKSTVVLSHKEWNPKAIKAMPKKVNEKGGASVALVSTQLNKYLSIFTMMMMTWGISDFVGDNGESDGKFGMSLNFPNEGYDTPETKALLEKFREFQNAVIDLAVENSVSWFGKKLTREVVEFTFFPIVKMSKNKETKQVDASSTASIRAKVPNYQGKWAIEIYDAKSNLIFPSEDANMTPMDFVPKMSRVACTLQCTGVWIGGKGWGVTLKATQLIVKPNVVESSVGRCLIQLSDEDMDSQIAPETDAVPVVQQKAPPAPAPVVVEVNTVVSTEVDDSDDEQDEPVIETPVVVVEAPVAPVPVAVKKVVKKAAVVEEVKPPPAVVEEAVAVPVVKKMVVKKKVLSA